MPINWNNIRPLNNSLNDGFEELVCQLAAREIITKQYKFYRIGKPDGGKECFWELTNGKLIMWQAKYFTTSLGSAQWKQIDDSVRNAIDNHPKLTKYYICLPIDMPDGKVNGKKSMLSKWNSKVVEWKNYALKKSLSVDFDFWGSSQLITKLSKKENEGLKYFWFNKEELSDEWFKHKNTESITALSARYTRELNVDLPMAKVFNGIARDTDFQTRLHKFYTAFLDKFRSTRITSGSKKLNGELTKLAKTALSLRSIFEKIDFTDNSPIPYNTFINKLDTCLDLAVVIRSYLFELQTKAEKKKATGQYGTKPFSNEINQLANFSGAANEFKRFLLSPACSLANKPFLLVTGDAGTGKSHLLADVIEKRQEKGELSLFLLGENFTTDEMPWTQILQNQLRKNNLDEIIFLGALNSKAESLQKRIVLFIDALNEGNGRKIWINRLRSFIETIKNYPWLGVVMSIRSSFEKLIAPVDEINSDVITRVNHRGFADNEYIAIKRYFQYYRITLPSSPFLNPEFQNPFFLKLFCKSLSERGLNHVPDGYQGITSIIDFFLESINIKLSKPDGLYYDERRKLVQKTVEKILLKIVEDGTDYIEFDEANAIVDGIFKDACSTREPYLLRLISEGIFNEDLHWCESGKSTYVIYFGYQRFQDHLTVSFLLDKYLDKKKPAESFKNGKLHDLVKDKSAVNRNQNLIEALSIQLPERINKELFEVAPHTKLYYSVAESFIQSLSWRKNNTIGETAVKYVNEVIQDNQQLFDQFLEAILLNSLKPDFYFNAERIHTFLLRFSMPERDRIWTIWLQNKYGDDSYEVTPVKKIIDFFWSTDMHSHIEDDSAFLGCITLSWFFTSCNRYLRDAATKSLVSLLQSRPHLIKLLLEKFKNVNDPYVLERIYCAAYGAVLRTEGHESLKPLCEYIYTAVFKQKEVYPHILLRDYAREIIEFANYVGVNISFDISRTRPPYKSKILPKTFPTVAAIDKKYSPKKDTGNYGKLNWGSTAILMSMTTEYGRGTAGYGDFGRYTFQAAFDDWEVDYNGLSNYAVQRIFELGYDPKLFTSFDAEQGSGRSAGHKERIGKKYQWIVFYELLARVSDQCKLTDESAWGSRPKPAMPYDGPWYPYVRDIDPSLLVREISAERYADEFSPYWWFNQPYTHWNMDNKKWIETKNDLPLPADILEVTDEENEKWLWLEIHPEWGEKEPLGEDKYSIQRKRLWYQMRSYLIKEKELAQFKKAFAKRDFYRGELPEARTMTHVYDREYYWSPAFKFFNKPYYTGEDWIKIQKKHGDDYVAELHRTTEYFLWEEEFDCSKESPIQFYKPVEYIVKVLQLKNTTIEGEMTDKTGKKVCFDPSVNNKSIGGLLIRKEYLLDFLKKEKLLLIWGVVGEKQFLGNFRDKEAYWGRQNISGLFTLTNEGINGKFMFEKEE